RLNIQGWLAFAQSPPLPVKEPAVMRFRSLASLLSCCALAILLPLVSAGQARAEELPPGVKASVNKGMKWMVDNQHLDCHWEAFGGQYPITCTALGGMCLLMEGSTIREGKYAKNIQLAVDFLMARAQPNGMIGNPNIPGEAGRYMYGHGFAMLFLACIYGEEE